MPDLYSRAIQDHAALIHWVAHRFGCGALPHLDDRLQAARIGLWRALATYDPTRARFGTHAVHLMVNEIWATAQREHGIRTVLPIEELRSVLADHQPTPEEQLMYQEESARLCEYAACVPRKRARNGATWTASDVAELVSKGFRPASIARMLGVSRERIRQVLQAIHDECARNGDVT